MRHERDVGRRLHEESILPWLLAVANNVVRTRARTSIERCSCGREIPNSITVVPK